MRFRIIAGFFFLLVLTVQAMAMKPSAVVKYMCESKRLSTSLSREQIKAEPGLYIGKIFELRGRVLGYAETDQGITMMLEDNNKESHCIKVDDRLEENPGTLVALLVKIGPESQYSLSDLRMLFWTYEADVTSIEATARKAAESRKARTSSRAQTNPRPVISTQPTTVTEMIRVYANAIRGYNRKLTKPASEKLAQAVLGFSQHYKLDPRLVMAVIISESRFRTDAVSGSGAMGLGQLMPSTAAGLGVNNAFDPVDNLYGSIRYIRSMVDRTSGKSWNNMTWQDLSLALAAYNAGPNAVKRHGGIPPYRETQNYVRKVTATYKQLCGLK